MKLQTWTPFAASRSPASNDETWSGSPFTLHRAVDRIFDDFFQGSLSLPKDGKAVRGFNPRLNIAETDKDYQISVELPGVEEKNVDLSIHDGLLTVKGSRAEEKEQKDKNYHRVESFYGSFERSVALPDGIDEDKVAASFKNGILHVTVPKSPESKPQQRKIPIQSA